jgi:hypothetical protein
VYVCVCLKVSFRLKSKNEWMNERASFFSISFTLINFHFSGIWWSGRTLFGLFVAERHGNHFLSGDWTVPRYLWRGYTVFHVVVETKFGRTTNTPQLHCESYQCVEQELRNKILIITYHRWIQRNAKVSQSMGRHLCEVRLFTCLLNSAHASMEGSFIFQWTI